MLKLHIKRVFRNIRKYLLFNLINFVGLTVALTITILSIAFVLYERSFDSFHSDSEQVYRVVQENHTANGIDYWSTTAYPLAVALRNDFPAIEVTQTAGPGSRLLTAGFTDDKKDIEIANVLFADSLFLSIFDYKRLDEDIWIQGNLSLFSKQNNAVVLTEKVAEKFFGVNHGNLVGQEMELNKNSILYVAGVIKNTPLNTSIPYEVIINYPFFQENNPYPSRNWSGNYQGYTYVKLPKHVDAASIEEQLPAFEAKYLSELDDERIEYNLQSLSNIHNDTTYSDSIASYATPNNLLNGVLMMALIIMIIACANYINLASAISIKRGKEVVVYKILGDSKTQLVVRQLLETATLVIIALFHAVVISNSLFSFFNQGILEYTFDLVITQELLFIIATLCLLIIIIAGAYPALVMSKLKPIDTLKVTQTYSGKGLGAFIRKFLIFIQFSFVHIVIIGVAAVFFQMTFLKNTELGFERDEILTFKLPQQDSLKIERLRTELLNHHAIDKVTFSSGVPFESDYQYGTSFRLASEEESMNREAEMKVMDKNYLELYDLKMISGKWINEANMLHWQQGFNGFVVNEALVSQLNLSPEEIIGKRIAINEGEAEVIGVVKDFHNIWLKESIKPCLMFYWGTGFFSKAAVKISGSENNEQTIAFIEQTWWKEYPDYVFQYEWFEDRIENTYAMESMMYTAMKIGALIAIILGGSGLFALVAFFTSLKFREVGIRKTLGASVSQIIIHLSSGFMGIVLVSVILSTVIGWVVVSNWLDGFTYKTNLTLFTYLMAPIITLCIAALSIVSHAIKSARTNPVDSLRHE